MSTYSQSSFLTQSPFLSVSWARWFNCDNFFRVYQTKSNFSITFHLEHNWSPKKIEFKVCSRKLKIRIFYDENHF